MSFALIGPERIFFFMMGGLEPAGKYPGEIDAI
jgi:hypothetical protein